jgi:hypothetical protein
MACAAPVVGCGEGIIQEFEETLKVSSLNVDMIRVKKLAKTG